MLGPFALILIIVHRAVRELTLGRGYMGYSYSPGSTVMSGWGNYACHQSWHRGVGLCSLYHRAKGMKAALLENFRKRFFLFQVKFPEYCSSINQVGALAALFSSFQREMVCWRVIPHHGFISFSCWDVLARSSPLVYWLQTICDCRGLWLLSLQKQGMQSIHEKHRTIFFSFKKCIFISASISGD